MTTKYRIHPLAEIFPPFTEKEFDDLVADMERNGQREPITLFDGKILDGLHRYKACLKLNLDPRVRNFMGKSPEAFAVSANLKRRHLNESQRALIAAELSGSKNGRPSENRTTNGTVSNKEAAKALKVSEHAVDNAKSVLKNAPAKVIQAIKAGATTVTAAVKEIKKKKDEKASRLTDQLGRVIPDDLVSEWQRAEKTGKKLQSLAREIKSILSEGFSGAKQERLKDTIYAEITNSAISDAQALSWTLSSVIPFALCPTCQGSNRKTCGLCKKRGWISKFLWNSPAVSEETKKLIGRINK